MIRESHNDGTPSSTPPLATPTTNVPFWYAPGLHHERVVEALQRILARVGCVVQRRVVAAQDQLDALQPHLAVRLGPAPVVADHHPDPAAERVPHAEAVGRGLEVVALGVLERAVGLVLLVAGDVDLLERGDDRTVALDERLHVPTVDAVGAVLEQRVAEAEPDAEPARLVEQRLRGVRSASSARTSGRPR